MARVVITIEDTNDSGGLRADIDYDPEASTDTEKHSAAQKLGTLIASILINHANGQYTYNGKPRSLS